MSDKWKNALLLIGAEILILGFCAWVWIWTLNYAPPIRLM